MKPNTIELFPDGRIGAYEKPWHIFSDSPYEETSRMYQQALEAAKRDAVYFKPDHPRHTKFALTKAYGVIQVGKPYPVPDGYKIEIKSEYVEPDDSIHCNRGDDIEYAILVPKEKVVEPYMGGLGMSNEQLEKQPKENPDNLKWKSDEPDYPIVDLLGNRQSVKQQSIEEAAEEMYPKPVPFCAGTRDSFRREGFIAGAKSQAELANRYGAYCFRKAQQDGLLPLTFEAWHEQFKQQKS